MTVQALIDELQQVYDKTLQVRILGPEGYPAEVGRVQVSYERVVITAETQGGGSALFEAEEGDAG